MIEPKIFKKYDIRGQAEGPNAAITPQAARLIGQAFGTYLQRMEGKKLAVVGRDNRTTSYDLAEAALQGLADSGCGAVQIGLVSTPLVYWEAIQRGEAGGVMVTGSHLAPDQNGFKLSVGARNLYDEKIQLLRLLIERNELAYGSAEIELDETTYSRYVRDLEKRLPRMRPLKIVMDAGNGTAGLFAPNLFKRWGHTLVECLYCEPNGRYPNHQPDPQQPQNLQALCAAVRAAGADIGLAFDGDGDRVGVVDETGQIIVADRVLALLARDLLARRPGAAVVADVLSSQVLFDEITRSGGQPVMWISGHSLIKAKMAEIGAPLGGEMSGHIFMGEDYYGFDDAYFVAGRLLQLLAAGNRPLSQLDAELPRLYSTPEYRPHCPDEAKSRVIAGVKDALAGRGDIVDVDGIRIRFERGWGLLRASNTEPVLSLRFEGQTEADALAYRDVFFEALAAFPEVVLT
ncbi:MAG: phosphomannomutase/phosphoglucomutase [Chloroflexi bacterium]|nr:phosphomannomutase/phosphoglucomutase [Chloroflexota bacterium]MDL1882403.1 phosphomannomutase/phosphoglucomutase [Anaerolineae bacterium CFX8]